MSIAIGSSPLSRNSRLHKNQYTLTGQQTGETPLATFQSNTELVLVPTVVVDHSGKHITNLKKEDFVLLEDKQERKIAFFEEIKPEPQVRDPRNKDTYTNYIQGNGTKSLTIFVLDMINTPFAGQAQARRVLLEILTNFVDDGQPKSLVLFTQSGIRVVHDFTTDPEALARALRKVVSKSVDPVTSKKDVSDSLYLRLSDFTKPGNNSYDDFHQRSVRISTRKCLREIASAFAGVPGRKALLWATAGFPYTNSTPTFESRNYPTTEFPDHEKTWRMLNAANVAIYPIDIRDMSIPGFKDARTRYTGLRQSVSLEEDNTATMLNFARETGGKSCIGRLDISECFRDALDDSRSYYMLGYYLDHNAAKPGWHKLQVKTKVNGSTVRARRGFDISNSHAQADLKAELDAAVTSPLDYTAVQIAAKWVDVSDKEPGKNRMQFDLVLPPGAFQFDEQDGNRMDLELIAALRKANGETVVLRDQELTAHLNADSIQRIRHDGFGHRLTLDVPDVPSGENNIRFLIRDNLTGKVGSVSVPLTVQ